MTQDVDSDTFYAVGGRLFELAGEVYDAFAVNVAILGGTGAMAGTDDAGTAWATSYDSRARDVLGAVNDLTAAMQNYGGVVIQAGYNHAVAEYNATASQRGESPQRPPEPASAAGVLSAPPSAGGPGKGLFDNALGLVEQVGVPVPDGDTVKVDTAAQAWDRLATVYQTVTVVEALEVNARAFSDTQSPEVEFIVRDLHELRDATSAILAGCRELAQSCTDYRAALEDLRDQLEDILTDLAIELAVTATITIFAACVSFGAGAVAGAAKTAHTISKFATTIRSAISAWKMSKRISAGVKKAHDIAGVRKQLERIKSVARKEKPEESRPGTRADAELAYNTRAERLNHTFRTGHKLEGLVERCGGREEAMREILMQLKGRVSQQGEFETVITSSGEEVTVRGFVDGAVIKIGTAFIP